MENVNMEEIIKRTWPSADPWAGSGQSEAPHPLPCPSNVHSVYSSHGGKQPGEQGGVETISMVQMTELS